MREHGFGEVVITQYNEGGAVSVIFDFRTDRSLSRPQYAPNIEFVRTLLTMRRADKIYLYWRFIN